MEVEAGEYLALGVNLRSLAVAPPGWLSADLHVHGQASFDSSLPDIDRVQSFVAHGIDVVASTDHDFVTDYSDTLRELGLDGQTVVIGGLETTQLIPHMRVPGSEFPKVIGHFNHWPIEPDPGAPRGGAPWDEKVCKQAAFSGHLDVLKWARANGAPWDEYVCMYAAMNGHLDVLIWARANGAPWDEMECYSLATQRGYPQIVNYIDSLALEKAMNRSFVPILAAVDM